jgi:hypothetical protein
MKKLLIITFFIVISFIAIFHLKQTIANTDIETNKYWLSANDYSMVNSNPKMCVSPSNAFFAAIQPIANGAWNQTSTWPNGQIPTVNDDVTIPANRTVTLAGTCRAKSIQVLGVLNASNQSIDLETESIVISGSSGKLEIGTEAQPYAASGKCLITLKGIKANQDNTNHKAIMVMDGGKLELHGKTKKSWTNLNATANVGSRQIVLKEAVNWEIGDIIALTSTDLANPQTKSWENVDEVEIESISTDKKTITLKTALRFKHIGGSKTYTRARDGKTWNVNIQGEVGLLSHHIKIQGKMDGTNQVDGFGGHIMMMKGSMAHVEQVELYKMGQKGIVGRYPFHWHLCEDKARGSYFKNSSVHRSFNRATTIHGTDYVTVDGIFAYDHIGHGIFLEDGGERFNNIKNNVVFVTRRPKPGEELTPSDNELNEAQNRTPSSYWITNPNNYFENNVAAGTEGTGFWIATPEGGPMALSAQLPYFSGVNPSKQNLGLFKGFVVHTCMNGWDVFDRLNPNHSLKKNWGWEVTAAQYLENGLLYGNETAVYCGLGVGGDATKVVFRNCAFSDNGIITMLAADLTLENCMFNGDSDLGVFTGDRHFFRFYDGPGRHHDCHFENWNRPYTYMIFQQAGGGATENFNPSFRGTTKGFSEPFPFRFFPLPNADETRTRKVGQFFKDYDGGLTGKAHTTIVRDIPFLTDGHEYRHASWRNAARSDYYFASLWMTAIEEIKMSIVRSKTGTADACFYESGTPSTGTYKFPMIVNEGFLYTYYFSEAPQDETGPLNRMAMIWSRGDAGDLGFICLKGLGKLSGFAITGPGMTVPLGSISAVANATDNAYFIAVNGDVYLKMKARGETRVVFGMNWTGLGTFQPATLPCATNQLTGVTANDTDGDGATDIEETENCGLVNSAADLNFEFNKTDEGFQRFNIVASNTSNETYWLVRADQSSDPHIVKSGLKFKGSEVPLLKVRIKSEAAGTFQLFWATTTQDNFSASRSITVAPSQTNVFEELVFNMSGLNTWMGQTITQIRIDFPPDALNNRHTFIDYMHGPSASNAGCSLNVSDNRLVEESISVYPNPSEDGIFFLSKEMDYEVYDMQGRRIIDKKEGSKIDLSARPKGIYILQVGKSTLKIIR